MMRALIIVAAMAAAACGEAVEPVPTTESSEASGAAAVTRAEDMEEQIIQLEREWVDAIVKQDTATLDRLLAEDFVGTSPTAHVYDKTGAIADLQRGTYVVKSMELDEVSANIYGGDMAVAFASQEEQSTYGGEDTSGHYHYTNVWVLRDGEWQVVASHGSRYSSPH